MSERFDADEFARIFCYARDRLGRTTGRDLMDVVRPLLTPEESREAEAAIHRFDAEAAAFIEHGGNLQ